MADKVSKSQLSKLQKTHKTDSRIGAALGVSRQSVHVLRKKLGVGAASAAKPDRDAEIAAAYIAGETGIAIAKRFRMSISQTYRIINAANGKAKRKAAVKRGEVAAPRASGRKASAKKASPVKPASKKTAAKKTRAKKSVSKKTAPAKKTAGKKRSKKK
jgi:hypothetical protein